MSEATLIKIDFNIEINHESLRKAELNIIEIKRDFLNLVDENTFDDQAHEDLFEKTVNNLDWIGRMSEPIFNIRDQLEEQYMTLYCKAPNLGRQLFEDHYHTMHHPFSLLKNRSYSLLDELDETFIQIHNRKPSNWVD